MKGDGLILLITLLTIIALVTSPYVKAADPIELTPTTNHHIAELNSNQPYVAGYHVNTPDLHTRETVQSTVVTVSFPSTDPSYFPSDSWLGAGMFVQAQDSRYRNVDYGFYTMLVLDSSGGLFVDLGFHQTRESTAPIQMPTEDLLYAYTWRISGIDPDAPVTLLASWDSEGSVHYSLSTPETNVTITSINVAALPNCENIIRWFYAGNAVSGMPAFPFGHFVYYFQFGVVSPKIIDNNHWSADLKEPKIFRKNGWLLIDLAWSTQGDISYLDYDWKWGGAPYTGVSAKHYQNPLQNPHETIFFYNGHTLPPGTVLWEPKISKIYSTGSTQSEKALYFLTEITIVTATAIGGNRFNRLRKKKTNHVIEAKNKSKHAAQENRKSFFHTHTNR